MQTLTSLVRQIELRELRRPSMSSTTTSAAQQRSSSMPLGCLRSEAWAGSGKVSWVYPGEALQGPWQDGRADFGTGGGAKDQRRMPEGRCSTAASVTSLWSCTCAAEMRVQRCSQRGGGRRRVDGADGPVKFQSQARRDKADWSAVGACLTKGKGLPAAQVGG